MRKISSIIATILMASLLFAGVAQAETCTISNTGPGSTNECEVRDNYTCEVRNNNVIDVDNDNDQTAGSGEAIVDGNTSGGGATSGSAGNSNSTEVEVDVTNSVCEAATTPTPTTPTTPEGGRGAGQVSGASTTASPSVGGRGAGEQVAAPVGGVGAGAGGLAVPAVVVSLLTAAVGARRLHRLANA